MDSGLVDAVLTGLAERADPERAQWQQDYMKSELPFHGVSLPETRALVRAALKEHPPRVRAIWEAVVRDFHRRHPLAGVRLSIHDMGATPAVVSLRLDQAAQELQP